LISPFQQFANNKGKTANKSFYVRLSNLMESIFHGPESLLDDSVVHLCSDIPGLKLIIDLINNSLLRTNSTRSEHFIVRFWT